MSTSSGTIRILLADSDELRSQVMAAALHRQRDFTVHACPMESEIIMHRLHHLEADVILLCSDRRGPDICLTVIRRIHVTQPQLPTILLSEALDETLVVNAFRSGVRGVFCQADAGLRDLCKCIRCVQRGEIWANSQQLRCLLNLLTHVPSLRVLNSQGKHLLTAREEQVVALVSEGMSNREIAAELALSEHTIKKYLFRIFDKLGMSSRVELVLYAMNHGQVREAEWVPGS